MPLQLISINSCNLPLTSNGNKDAAANEGKINKNLTKAFVKDYVEVKANGKDEVGEPSKVQDEEVDMACEQCCRFYYEWNDEEDSQKDVDEWSSDVVKKGMAHKKNSGMFLAHVAGCHDANFTAGEVFLRMLRDERAHQIKATSVAYHDKGKQLNGKLDFVMPSEDLCKLRNETVDQMIFGIGQKLRQSALTQHLAVKLFDLAFVHQQEFTGGLDEAISRFVRQSLVAAVDEKQEGNSSKEDKEN